MNSPGDTICALSSGASPAGIAVVRLSGPEGPGIVRGICAKALPGGRWEPRLATLEQVIDPDTGLEVDEVLVTHFVAPASYTGEDVIELSLHGNPVLVSAVLELLCRRGARLAEPGEFTLRAFLNGRMDLAQAEAVNDVIHARTLFGAQMAARQRSGELSRALQPVQKLLVDLVVQLESSVEFVEQDLPTAARAEISAGLVELRTQVDRWVMSFRKGRLLRQGFGLAIVGRPNVGKSSLFNALLERDRSIVTERPGTTRDTVSEFTNIGGLPVHLVDTAGLRQTSDHVELLGVNRSVQAIADADAVLFVVDGSSPPVSEDLELRSRLEGTSCFVVMNKSDLPTAWSGEEISAFLAGRGCARVSAKSGEGIDGLRRGIREQVFGPGGEGRDGLLITNLRHSQCLQRTAQHLSAAALALTGGLPEEFVLADLHGALRELGRVTGETSVEDLLGEIFSRFCIGK